MKQYTNIYKLYTVLFITVVLFAAIGCEPAPPTATPSKSGLLGGATMATSIDSTTLKPLKITGTFKKDAPTIYCSALLIKAPEKTIIQAQMVLVKGPEGQENLKLKSAFTETDGTRFLSFSWLPGDHGWTAGDYNIVLSVNGKEDMTVAFKVE
jgi:hypothetical protein